MRYPDKLIGFKVYDEGNNHLGVADVELPSLEYMTETISGAGIAGEADTPTLGQFSSMTTTINFRALDSEFGNFVLPKGRMLDYRGSIQNYESRTGEILPTPVKVTMSVLPKNYSVGSFKPASATESSAELEITYLKIFVDNEEIVEFDRFNYICKVNGEDYLEEVRKHLGM